MIEQLSGFSGNVVAFRCSGRVTKADYDSVLVPAVVDALRTHDKVRLYYETSEDFAGFEAGAMWVDFKIGVKHWMRWERVAIVTDVNWMKKAVRLFAFLMPATTRLFLPSESTAARAWLVS
jgi:SpoIIAA-like